MVWIGDESWVERRSVQAEPATLSGGRQEMQMRPAHGHAKRKRPQGAILMYALWKFVRMWARPGRRSGTASVSLALSVLALAAAQCHHGSLVPHEENQRDLVH